MMRVYVCLNLCAQSHTHTHTHTHTQLCSSLPSLHLSPPSSHPSQHTHTHTHIIIVSIIIFLLSRRVVGWRRRRRRRQQLLHIRSEHVHYVHSSYNADEVHSQHSHLRLLVHHLHLTRPRRHHVRRREALIVRIVTMTQTRDTSSRWAGQLRAISAAERRQYVARSCL